MGQSTPGMQAPVNGDLDQCASSRMVDDRIHGVGLSGELRTRFVAVVAELPSRLEFLSRFCTVQLNRRV
jgi:hypothetical protein